MISRFILNRQSHFLIQLCFTLAAFFVMGAGVWFYFITKSNRVMTYPATALLGFGFSAMLVNALSFATELIGDNKVSSIKCDVIIIQSALSSIVRIKIIIFAVESLTHQRR